MRAAALALACLIGLTGCLDAPSAPGKEPLPQGSVAIVAANNATIPVWFLLHLTENGTTRVSEERMVAGGGSTTWRHTIGPAGQVRYELDYRAGPGGTGGGFGSAGRINATLCPGTFWVEAWAQTLGDGTSMEMRSRSHCQQ